MDYTTMTDEELHDLIAEAKYELGRRQTVQAVNDQVADVLRTARTSGAISTPEQGAEWVQPTGAQDSYVTGDVVTYNGKTWVSTVSANTWAPGTAGWREQAGTDEDGNEIPAEWVQPSGSADAYSEGERVTYNGSVFESVIDANVWSPDSYPASWQKQ